MGIVIVLGPVIFFILKSGKDNFHPGIGGVFDYYSKTVIHSTLVAIPFLILYTIWVSYLNLKIKETIVFKGADAFSGLFLVMVIYALPVDIHFESLVQNKDMEFIYGLLIFITPFFLKRADIHSVKE